MRLPALRKALVERYPRERFWLTDKITLNYIKKPEDQEPFFQRQLELCGVDWFDLYLIHKGLYNNYKRLENTGYMYNQKVYYANLATVHGKASDCIGCSRCERNCPQRLPIRTLLKKVSETLE